MGRGRRELAEEDLRGGMSLMSSMTERTEIWPARGREKIGKKNEAWRTSHHDSTGERVSTSHFQTVHYFNQTISSHVVGNNA